MQRLIGVVAAASLAAACGGRAADPVAAERPLDARMSCAHIAAEQRANAARAGDLDDEGDATAENALAGAILLSPLYINVRGATGEELEALATRNERLAALAEEKGCAPADDGAAAADAPASLELDQ